MLSKRLQLHVVYLGHATLIFESLISRLVQVSLRLIRYGLRQVHLIRIDLLYLLVNEVVLLVTEKQLCQLLMGYLVLTWKLILGWLCTCSLAIRLGIYQDRILRRLDLLCVFLRVFG